MQVVELEKLQQEIINFIEHKNYKKAIKQLQNILLIKKHWTFYLQLGNCYYHLQDFTNATINFYHALELAPNSSSIYNSIGLVCYKKCLWQDAKKHFQKAIRLRPNNWESHFNLANTLTNLDCHIEALSHYKAAHQLQPENSKILHNLTFSYIANGELILAIPYLKELTKIDNQAWPYLAHSYTVAGQLIPAIQAYLQALQYLPAQGSWYHNLAILYLRNENFSQAKHYFSLALSINNNNITAQHMLDALSDKETHYVPKQFIQDLFAQYADHYNEHMKHTLNYQLPGIMRTFLSKHIQTHKSINVLDLGCGTGLSGIAFKDLAKVIVGTDLSLAMLKKAQELNIYDYILHADITTHIPGEQKDYFQLILGIELLSYIGALEKIFTNVYNALTKNGIFLFSVEETDKENYTLLPSGRFAYNEEYINKCATKSLFTIIKSETAPLRIHANKTLYGKIYFCQKV